MRILVQILAAVLAISASTTAGKAQRPAHAIALTDGAPIVLLVDLQSGQRLFERNADRRFVPASITKIMTAFVAFELIAAERLQLADKFAFNEAAAEEWYRKGSTLFLEPGEVASVDLLLRGIASVSANDASIVLAEGAAGSVDRWITRMNTAARQLGMTNSHFGTPNGWPDEGATFTTADDLVKLGNAMVTRHPDLYARYFGKEGLRHNGFTQANHDPISGVVDGADGMKTGYTNQAGYGFVGSAERDGTRLLMVVAGAETGRARDRVSRDLIEWGYSAFARKRIFDRESVVGNAQVQDGEMRSVGLAPARAVSVAGAANSFAQTDVRIVYDGPLQAPIARGETVARLKITAPGTGVSYVPLRATEHVAKASALTRIRNAFASLFA